MVKYSREASLPAKACKAMGTDLRVHYKNTFEVCGAIRGMRLKEAQKYLDAVIEGTRCIPYRRYTGKVGRTAQAKAFKATQGRWPQKSCKVVLDLLKNAESNADFKNLDVDNLFITHIQCNQAQHGRRRTYRAHGRINAYTSSPCHVELIVEEKAEHVDKAPKKGRATKFTKAQVAKRTLRTHN